MKEQNKLSAVIITFNEEKNIARCIDSLAKVADEIVVVDSFSTDNTKAICKQKKVNFISHKFEGHIEQKNFALTQTRYNFVLSLDADEALDASLQSSILEAKQHFQQDAYSFNRLTNFCGQWIKHCGWYPDTKLRLWNKEKGTWGGENPHDKVIMQPKHSIKKLEGDLLHYSFYTINDHLQQIHFFTDISAKAAFRKGKKSSIFKMIFKPAFKFIRDYLFKAGFLDGYYGFVICTNSAYAKYLKYLKLHELNRKEKNNETKT